MRWNVVAGRPRRSCDSWMRIINNPLRFGTTTRTRRGPLRSSRSAPGPPRIALAPRASTPVRERRGCAVWPHLNLFTATFNDRIGDARTFLNVCKSDQNFTKLLFQNPRIVPPPCYARVMATMHNNGLREDCNKFPKLCGSTPASNNKTK